MPGCLRTAGVPVLLLACQSTPGLPGLSLRVCGTGIAAHTPSPLPVQLQSCNGDAAGARDSPRAIHSTSSEFTGVSQNQHPSAPTPGRLIPPRPSGIPSSGAQVSFGHEKSARAGCWGFPLRRMGLLPGPDILSPVINSLQHPLGCHVRIATDTWRIRIYCCNPGLKAESLMNAPRL